MHQSDSVGDLPQRADMSYHPSDVDFSIHIPVNDLRHIGAAARAAERSAFPHPTGHKLERPCGNFLSGFPYPDHHGNAPAAMARFKRVAYYGGVAGAVEGEVGAAVGERDQVRNDVATDLRWIDEMRHTKAAAPFLLCVVDVNSDDLVGANHPGALNDVESDSAQPEHDHVGARRDLGGVNHCADACRHTAADVATLVEGGILADLCHGNFRQHGKVRKCRATHVVEDRLTLRVTDPGPGGCETP